MPSETGEDNGGEVMLSVPGGAWGSVILRCSAATACGY